MRNDHDGYTGELYFHTFDFADEEKDAIAVLFGLHPDDVFENDEDEDTEGFDSERMEFMIFLMNALDYFRRVGFQPGEPDAYADLSSYAEYLRDTMHLMCKTDEYDLSVIVLASIASGIHLDTISGTGGGGSLIERWHGLNAQAIKLVSETMSPRHE